MTAPSLSHSPARRSLPRAVSSVLVDRVSGLPAWVVLTQLFIGLGWLRAVVEKVIDPAWWRGDVITSFLLDHDELTLGWYEPFADGVVAPNAVGIAVVVVLAQLAAGASLVTGRAVGAGLTAGMFLNLHFVAAGAVNPSAFYLLSQGAIALWLIEQRPARVRTRRLLHVAAIGAATAGVLSVPFVSTLHPAHVIDDPAVMFGLGAVLTVVGCDLAHRQLTGGDGLA